MDQHYFQPDQWLSAARNALKPRILSTMALSVLAAVVIYGIFRGDAGASFTSILSSLIGGLGALFAMLFGLTALAHQLHCQMSDEFVPNSFEAARFAWGKAQSILMLPLWAAGMLLALVLAELVVLSLANIPALGLIWLVLIGVPLLLLNTVVAVALMLALFNMAARVAIADTDAASLQQNLWRLMKARLPELLIYNLGGVMVTAVMAALVLSPLWLGAQMTLVLVDYAASEPMMRAYDSVGFWGSVAHLVGLIMLGLLLAAVVSVPGVVITQMTLLVHLELNGKADDAVVAQADGVEEGVRAKGSSGKRAAKKASADEQKDASSEEGAA
jgi:hypothetical protein